MSRWSQPMNLRATTRLVVILTLLTFTEIVLSWNNRLNLSNNIGSSFNPSLAVDSSGTIHAVWTDNSINYPGTSIVLYRVSNDGGVSWSAAQSLSDAASYAQQPRIAAPTSGHRILAWHANGLYVRIWNGSAWLSATKLTDGRVDQFSVGMNANGIALVAWQEGHMVELYGSGSDPSAYHYRRWDGASWSNDVLGTGRVVAMSGSLAYLATQQHTLLRSDDAGLTWGTPISLPTSYGQPDDMKIDSTGRLRLAWFNPGQIQVGTYAGSSFSEPITVGVWQLPNTHKDLQLAINGRNEQTLLWTDTLVEGSGDEARPVIRSVFRVRSSQTSDGSRWTPPTTVDDDALGATVAGDPTGAAFFGAFHTPGSSGEAPDVFIVTENGVTPPVGTYTIRGTAVDSTGAPLVGVTITSSDGHQATTDGMGAYVLTGLTAGSYTLTAALSGYRFLPISSVTVPPSQVGVQFVGTPNILTIVPIAPLSLATPLSVMQGGTVHAYTRLLKDGQPVADATVSFSAGAPVTSNQDGVLDYAVAADNLGGPGSYQIRFGTATLDGAQYRIAGAPVIGIEVDRRHATYTWSTGAAIEGKGGISAGLVGYLRGKVGGGLNLTLDESDPQSTTDDQVDLAQQFENEAGAGGGVGLDFEGKLVVLKLELESKAVAESAMLRRGQITTHFAHPYDREQRKAQGGLVLASLIDASAAVPGSDPLIRAILRAAATKGIPYQSYVSQEEVGWGLQTKVQANTGAEISLGVQKESRLLSFDLVDRGITLLTFQSLTQYRDKHELGLASESELTLDLSALSVQIGDFKTKFAEVLGTRARKIRIEAIVDSAVEPPQLKRLEVTLSSEGNPFTFTDVLKDAVALKFSISADQLTPTVLGQTANILAIIRAAQNQNHGALQIGTRAMQNDLSALLSSVKTLEYEVMVDDTAETAYSPGIELSAAIKISISPEFAVKKTRHLVRERGLVLDQHTYVIEQYEGNVVPLQPGTSWPSLARNAVGGLWDAVQDSFSWNSKTLDTTRTMVVQISASTVNNVLQGGMQLIIPPGVQIQANGEGKASSNSAPVTVTAVGWVPLSALPPSSSGPTPTADRSFVVGGMYDLQPTDLTVAPAATMVLTYTDQAAAGIDELTIGLYHWEPAEGVWQAIPAQHNIANNTVTATITRLGTYALGHDSTPPQIRVLTPEDRTALSNTLAQILVEVQDTGVGVNTDSLELKLDGKFLTTSYITSTGLLIGLPTTPLAQGTHEITVVARDAVGNIGTTRTTFIVVAARRIYLPYIRR